MSFVFFGHKINEFRIGRIKGSFQGFLSGIGDRANGQAADFICIIWSKRFKVAAL